MPLDYLRVKSIFGNALQLDDPRRRAAFLDQECGVDADLRGRVEALLAAVDRPGLALDGPPPLAAGATAADFLLGATVAIPSGATVGPGEAPRPPQAPVPPATLVGSIVADRYKVREAIGEGGMGTVYLAEQVRPVRRQVALKLIRAGMDSRTVLARFESERQALALMDHPHIARVLDAGTTEAGHPYFVMELVRGVPLTDFCDRHRLDLPTRLALFRQICSAVQHAHQKGIIHRDLKPTNILVEDHDGTPVPKVIDFGLAKATSGLQLTDQSLYTAFGTIAGTPLYMAPEQATFNALDVDTRADIYALGVILYELLTGTTPIRRESLQKAALDEVMRVIREDEPPTPSHRISTSQALPSLAATRQVEPIRLSRFVRGDLDWIVMKALAKERARRYDSAIGLANDVERFLHDEPVLAGPPTARYRAAKFVRRHRGQVVAASLIVLALVGGVVGTTFGFVRARAEAAARQRALVAEAEQRREAERQGAVARGEAAAKDEARLLAEHRLAQVTKMNEVLAAIFGDLDVSKEEKEGRPLAAALGDRLDRAAASLEGEALGDPLPVARMQATLAASQFSLGYLRRSIDLYERAVPALAKLLGSDHPETLTAMSQLGGVYTNVGQTDRAVALNERAVAGLQARLGPDHPKTLFGMRRLAFTYRWAGQADQAVATSERTLEEARVRLGPDHLETVLAEKVLAFAYRWAGRLDRAIPLFERALEGYRAGLGPDHFETFYTMTDLAVAYALCGDFERALTLHDRAVEGFRAKVGPNNLYTLYATYDLAETCMACGQFARAIRLFEQILPELKAKSGPEDLTHLFFMYDLIQAYTAVGQIDRAASMDGELLNLARSTRGHMEDNNLMTSTAKALFGGASLRRKQYAEAASFLQEAYEGMCRLGANIPPEYRKRLPETLDRLIQLAEETGKPEEAKAWRAEKARVEALPGPVFPAAAKPAGATP